jgi:hypothetical protein
MSDMCIALTIAAVCLVAVRLASELERYYPSLPLWPRRRLELAVIRLVKLTKHAMHVEKVIVVVLRREMPVAAYARRVWPKSACLSAGGARCWAGELCASVVGY